MYGHYLCFLLGEEPSESPQELMQELDRLTERLMELISRINLTNSITVHEGERITTLLARRELSTPWSRHILCRGDTSTLSGYQLKRPTITPLSSSVPVSARPGCAVVLRADPTVSGYPRLPPCYGFLSRYVSSLSHHRAYRSVHGGFNS